MHALSRDTEAFPFACIYLQLDEGSERMSEEGKGSGEEEEELPAEVRLVPADASQRAPSILTVFFPGF